VKRALRELLELLVAVVMLALVLYLARWVR
jgi:hypothetical protein